MGQMASRHRSHEAVRVRLTLLRPSPGPRVGVPLAVFAVAVFAAVAAGAATARTTAPMIRCTNGVVDQINGRTVCIHVGGKCVAAHEGKYRKRGFTCKSGRLKRYVPPAPAAPPAPPAPPPAPPAPPPPPAAAGHYQGKTSQLEDIQFDVISTGRGVTGFAIHTVNQSCDPYGGGIWFGVKLTGTAPIRNDGTFDIDLPETVTFNDGTVANGRFTLHGAFTGTTASGTFTNGASFSYQGAAITCSSGVVSWSVTKTG